MVEILPRRHSVEVYFEVRSPFSLLRCPLIILVGIRAFVVQQDILPRGVPKLQNVFFPQLVIPLSVDGFVVEVSLVGGAEIDDVWHDAFPPAAIVASVFGETVLQNGVLFRAGWVIHGNVGDQTVSPDEISRLSMDEKCRKRFLSFELIKPPLDFGFPRLRRFVILDHYATESVRILREFARESQVGLFLFRCWFLFLNTRHSSSASSSLPAFVSGI